MFTLSPPVLRVALFVSLLAATPALNDAFKEEHNGKNQ